MNIFTMINDAIVRWFIKTFFRENWATIYARIDFCEVGRIGRGSEFIDRYVAKHNDWNELTDEERRIFRKDIKNLRNERRDCIRYLTIGLACA